MADTRRDREDGPYNHEFPGGPKTDDPVKLAIGSLMRKVADAPRPINPNCPHGYPPYKDCPVCDAITTDDEGES